MARITIEDCLKQVDDKFSLVQLVIKRVKQLREGAEVMVNAPDNREIVLAMREIAAGKVLLAHEERSISRGKEDLEDQPTHETKKIDIDEKEISSEFKEIDTEEDSTEHKDIQTEQDTDNDDEEEA
jgi:DNA-directed RNA polymerase subunit omega